MSIILGIDIGGSTTKIVGLRPDGSVIAKRRVQAQDPITSLYGAMGNFLFTNSLELGDVSRIALTGVQFSCHISRPTVDISKYSNFFSFPRHISRPKVCGLLGGNLNVVPPGSIFTLPIRTESFQISFCPWAFHKLRAGHIMAGNKSPFG